MAPSSRDFLRLVIVAALAAIGILPLLAFTKDLTGGILDAMTLRTEVASDSANAFEWMKQHEEDFPFSMKQSPVCETLINDYKLLANLGRVAINDWIRKGGLDRPATSIPVQQNETLTAEMEQAEQAWNLIWTACHGPLPDPLIHPELATNLTLRAFMYGMAHCGDKRGPQDGGHPYNFDGAMCIGGWHETLAQGLHYGVRTEGDALFATNVRENSFVMTSRCALKFEFPVMLSATKSVQSTTNRQTKPTDWKPKRTIVLAPTLGEKGATMGCRLVATAFPRGWEIVLIEGEYRGIRYKYSDAIRALRLVVEQSDVAAEDTLVVFADASDVLAQRTPEAAVEAFMALTSTFAFSTQGPWPFPMGSWPHTLGIPFHTCEGHFPLTENHYQNGHKYANTGGWVGLASSAFVVLKELATLVENEGHDRKCHETGTDQLLGNVAHLRNPSLVGLDSEFGVFATGAWELMRRVFTKLTDVGDDNRIYGWTQTTETGEERLLSPVMFHFNGEGDSGGKLDETFEVLTSEKSLKKCRQGKVVIADIRKGKVWTEDFFLTARWRNCSSANHCAKRGS